MKECPKCHNMVENDKDICPHCGYDFTTHEVNYDQVKDLPNIDHSRRGWRCPKCFHVSPYGTHTCPHCKRSFYNDNGKRKTSIYTLVDSIIASLVLFVPYGALLLIYLLVEIKDPARYIQILSNNLTLMFIITGAIAGFFSITYTFFSWFFNEKRRHRVFSIIFLVLSAFSIILGAVIL